MQYIDLSLVIGVIIALMLALIVRKVWPLVEAIMPPVGLAFLKWFAESVVNSVEAEYGGDNGAEKREMAFKRINQALEPINFYLQNIGFTISSKSIYEAIEAAWYKMNLDQIRAGVKAPPDTFPE